MQNKASNRFSGCWTTFVVRTVLVPALMLRGSLLDPYHVRTMVMGIVKRMCLFVHLFFAGVVVDCSTPDTPARDAN